MNKLAYKLVNFFAGFILFHYLCQGLMLVLWYHSPETGGWMEGGVWKVARTWAILNWVAAFDTLGFLRKLGSAVATSFGPLMSLNPTGETRQAPRTSSAVSTVLTRLSGFGLVYLCCLIPLTLVDYLAPDVGLFGRYRAMEVVLLLAALSRCLNSDLFKFIDRRVGEVEDDASSSRPARTEGKPA